MIPPAITLDGLTRQLGSFNLGPLTLDVPRGAIFALIGPNGAGKTTLLDMLMGMGRPDGGRVQMLGMDFPANEVEIKRRTAYVNPDFNYQPWGTVGRAIDFVRGFYPDWDGVRCDRLLEAFNLSRPEKVMALSFGGRMKLALVLALSRNAELLLLDEPTVGLDAGARRHLFAELLAFMQREDRTIVISSHQLTDLERFADHVALLNRGRLMTAGRMDELVDRYRQLDVRTGRGLAISGGVHVLSRDGDRAQILIDRSQSPMADLTASGIEVLSETPVTLEEIVVSLMHDKPWTTARPTR